MPSRFVNRWEGLGCCGSMFRFFLILINSLLFVTGTIVFILAAVLKWGKTSFSDFQKDSLYDIIEVGKIGNLAFALLVLGGIIALIGMFGLCGSKWLSKTLLVIYELILLILFMVHFILILVLLFGSSSIEEQYRKGLNQTVKHINSGENSDKYCKGMKAISTIFHCCGVNGPDDIKNSTATLECCHIDNDTNAIYKQGCADLTVALLKKNALNFLIIPSCVILFAEFYAILMIPFLIGRIRNTSYAEL